MSKISDENSDRQKSGYSSKPWKGRVTDLILRFQKDVFLSTRVKIIVFHTLSVIVIILITIVLIEYIQQETLLAILESFNTLIRTGVIDSEAFAATNINIRSTQVIVFSVIIAASIIFGIIASRLALKPMQDALTMQKRFIASVAHELRTPLAVMKTDNEVAKLDAAPDSTMARILTENVEEIDHITEILNNLLLFNRVDTLESIVFEEVDLSEILEMVMKRLRRYADKQKIIFEYERTEIPVVYGNATALEQAFFNIVKNALSYTQQGGAVRIWCSSVTEHAVTIDVSDNGAGIPKKDLRHIFEPFYRSKSGETLARGSGLGLAIVFEIIKLHNGRIDVESTANEGSHFSITIPKQTRVALARPTPREVTVSYDFSRHDPTL